ncbi:recombination-associated protein RdgC [Hahella sp. KA22]|uniref:recombination-associated protein RdgC n=1 Tax=Hahella sp. KA22 TaxID=1628392 RepID=UPI000FDEF319|nr:recombination-associated protein RdgC [Hahella sp. KA22]AZZ91294.1 recombination-associated protein RdgC [Hahella sp. KA22]QAY54663.1 recombination-associated protein RdgC [Hahella sp. KA22]
MLFKNALIYRFTKPVPWPLEDLETGLSEHAFTPCQANDTYRLGWVPAAPLVSDALVYQQGRYLLLTLKREEKILPASVIKEEVEERAQEIEEREQRKLRKKEKNELKEQVITVLLPQAFKRSRLMSAYIDLDKGLLVVDTSSGTRADEFTSFLRQSMGTLPIRFVALNEAPAVHFSDWVQKDNTPTPFVSGDNCELRSGDGSDTVIRCKGTESLTDAISTHIENGMQVTQLSLEWDEKLSFAVGDDLKIKRIKFMDTLQEQLKDGDTGEAAERFAADFSLMTLEFSRMTDDLIKVLGGEDMSAVIQE